MELWQAISCIELMGDHSNKNDRLKTVEIRTDKGPGRIKLQPLPQQDGAH